MFLVPKKGGKSRPIINLKPLNRYVRTPHFTMTTLKDVSQLIQPRDWAVCLDLRHAYFHVPVHTRRRRFLQLIWKGQTYRYTALPFGLSTSPFCFTKVTKPTVQYLRSQGVRVVFYLEDVLLLAQTRRGAQENRRRVVHLLGKLGFSLNHEKSDFVPRQSFSYLGLQWDTRSMQVRLQVAEIRSLAASLQDRRVVSARSLMTFLGKVTFASYGVELARLHSRELQTALRTVSKRPRDICRTVHLHREALHSLDFWKELTPSLLPLRRPQAEIIMAKDASSSGWGGSLHALSASGRWSRGQRSRHINSLELMAVENSLRSFQDRVEGRTVCVQINNRTQWPTWRRKNSVAYLVKEGGTKSVRLSRLACRILLWCQWHRITLIPVYVRGIGNTIADALSRGQDTQWHLSPKMVDGIFRRYGTPQVDLFASRETAQLPQYMTLQRGDNQALAVDTLSQTWDFDLVYASPLRRLSRRWPTSSGAPRPECC